MGKGKFSRYLFAGLLLTISLFLITFAYFHSETDLNVGDNCPICLFERSATFFWALNSFLLIFSSLLLITFKIFPKDNEIKFTFISHILGQRAPPQI